jgi:hypothetical protein
MKNLSTDNKSPQNTQKNTEVFYSPNLNAFYRFSVSLVLRSGATPQSSILCLSVGYFI